MDCLGSLGIEMNADGLAAKEIATIEAEESETDIREEFEVPINLEARNKPAIRAAVPRSTIYSTTLHIIAVIRLRTKFFTYRKFLLQLPSQNHSERR